MNELIKLTTTEQGIQAVSARELHRFLESKQEFSNWIKERINKYDLVLDRDYTIEEYNYLGIRLDKIIKSNNQQVARREYILTIDTAKELSMVEGNEKGKQARRYFIECEKQLKQMQTQPKNPYYIPQNYYDALILAANQAKQIDRKNLVIAEQIPKVNFANSVLASGKSILIGELAKILTQNGYATGQNKLFEYLREKGYLCLRGCMYNQPTQKAMDLGLFEISKHTITRPDGNIFVCITSKVTPKGQMYFINRLAIPINH